MLDMVKRKKPSVMGRPREIEGDKKIDTRIPDETFERIDNLAKERGISRGEIIRDAAANYVSDDQLARRKAERLEMVTKMLDGLGHTGPARDAAIQRLIGLKLLSEADAKELAKSKPK